MKGRHTMRRTGANIIMILLVSALLSSFFMPAAVSYAAEKAAEHSEEEGGWDARTEIPRIVNFVIIVVMLWFFLRKPLARYFANRREEIERQLDEARRARDQAEAKAEEYRQKLLQLEQEVAAMRSESEKERENLRQVLLSEARNAAGRVVEQARANIELERKRAIDSVRTEASLLALELAERLLKENIQPEDRERIDRECIEGLRSG